MCLRLFKLEWATQPKTPPPYSPMQGVQEDIVGGWEALAVGQWNGYSIERALRIVGAHPPYYFIGNLGPLE